MFRRTALALSLAALAAAAHADTENVRQWRSQVEFRTVAGNASGGSSAPRPPASAQKQDVFGYLDFDGDGFVSKAEAAGHAPVTVGFDRADRNRDGKLSFAEYDSIGKPRPARAKGKRKTEAKKSG